MLASVVIACYKHEAYLEHCLETVFDQTYPQLELIIVDDNSPDNSYQLAERLLKRKSFAKRFASCKLLKNPTNMGAHFTWNRALSLATGEMLFLLNSDDAFSKERVEAFVGRHGTEKLFFGFSAIEPIDENGKSIKSFQFPARLRYATSQAAGSDRPLSWSFLESQIAASTGNFVLSAELLKRAGWFADLKYCHDWEFALRAITIVEPKYVEADQYMYRLHASNSFRGLSGVAESETRACMQTYSLRAMVSKPGNRTCLSPLNMGDAFYRLIKNYPNFNYWMRQLYAPYLAEHRTVEKNQWTVPAEWR
jgi:glycosyltransferase involved in cell wall biosynthesis